MRIQAAQHRLLLAVVLVASLLLGLPGCGDGDQPQRPRRTGPPVIYTTLPATTWMVQELVGELANVTLPQVPEGTDPAFWQPSDETLAAYQQADLIVLNGAEYEQWAVRMTLPPSRVVDASKSFAARFINAGPAITHSHGDDQHTHNAIDGHTWLDPILAIRQSVTIRDAVKRLLPEHHAAIDAHHAALVKQLQDLDGRLRALGTLPEGEVLVASHPAYNYLARQYGWEVVSFELDARELPAADEFRMMQEDLTGKTARYMLWEDEPLPEVAKAVEDKLGLASVWVSPGKRLQATKGEVSQGYIALMRANVERLAKVFQR